MKRGTLRLIIALSALLMAGLVVTQIFWVRKAYEVNHWQVEHDIIQSLVEVAQQIREDNNDTTQIVDPVRKVSENSFTISINDTLHPYYLESLLTSEFRKRELNLDFEFSIYDCFTDAVVYSKEIMHVDEKAVILEGEAPDIDWDSDGHYFSVTFPKLELAAVRQLNFWIVSSLLLLIVVFFFSYTLSIIMRQKRVSEVKTDFINNMTHELKTPISTIALSSDVLLQDNIVEQPERLKNYATIIRNENNRLQNQVERVLQMAALDKEVIDLKKKDLDLHEFLREAVLPIELNIQERNGSIALKLEATKSHINADTVHLTNIVHNLLDNANKYSENQPKITVSTWNKGNQIVLEIADQGIGIQKAYLKQVFERFFRVPTGNRHDVKGFGLGLYYVKTLVEAHKGQVRVQSEVGKGTRFEIILPTVEMA